MSSLFTTSLLLIAVAATSFAFALPKPLPDKKVETQQREKRSDANAYDNYAEADAVQGAEEHYNEAGNYAMDDDENVNHYDDDLLTNLDYPDVLFDYDYDTEDRVCNFTASFANVTFSSLFSLSPVIVSKLAKKMTKTTTTTRTTETTKATIITKMRMI